MESNWKLGEDLIEDDNILDAITFKELIMTVQCNSKDLTIEEVKKNFEIILNHRLEDAYFLLERNADTIIEIVKQNKGMS